MTTARKSSGSLAQLERAVIKCALARLVQWQKDHPEGLLPLSNPDSVRPVSGWKLIKATIALAEAQAESEASLGAARKKGTTE